MAKSNQLTPLPVKGLNPVNVLLQLMDELELILEDTSNEELTPEKKLQYNSVSCNCLQFTCSS